MTSSSTTNRDGVIRDHHSRRPAVKVPKSVSGNHAILDKISALECVRDNVVGFRPHTDCIRRPRP
jgi:hypothetical protein